jgi:AraC-like DNA-binding protein
MLTPSMVRRGNMWQSFSTDLLPVSDRLEAWRWNAQQICGDSRFEFPKRLPFHGSIARHKVAGLEFTLFASSALSFKKFPVHDLRSDNRACIVITQLRGERRYYQQGKVAILRRGDSTLIDSGHPWSSDCQGDCVRLYMRVPYAMMEEKLKLREVPMTPTISGASAPGAVLHRIANSMYQQAEDFSSKESAAAVEAYLNVLSACFGNSRCWGRASRTDMLSQQVVGYIATHLAEATLSPPEIASALGISVRHLHRIFSRTGCTVGDSIRDQRLRECRKEIGDPRLSEKSITEIAFFWGFNDSAHFSRAFKKQFGVCPRSYRSRLVKNSNGRRELMKDFGYLSWPSMRPLQLS